jgi:hypothetical protein
MSYNIFSDIKIIVEAYNIYGEPLDTIPRNFDCDGNGV